MKLLKRSQIVAVLALASLLAACADATLTQIAKGLDEANKTVGIVQTTVIEAERQKFISESDTATILRACTKVNEGGKAATAYAKTITALAPVDRSKLLNLINPGITAVGTVIQSGTVGIKDVPTQQKIQLLLLSLQATLNTVQVTLSGGA